MISPFHRPTALRSLLLCVLLCGCATREAVKSIALL